MINNNLNNLLKYTSYQELKQKFLNNSTKKEKGDIFELLTKYYLLINPIYKTKLKEVWLLNEVSNEIKNYLNLPDNDEGIDLIAQTKDDEYWAIQCKYRTNEDSSITRDDIATFLDVSNNICRNISHKLVCTTADRQSYKFEKFYDDKITFLLANTWNDLDEEFFNQLNLLVENKAIHIGSFKPKEHQIRAIENAYNHFEEENNSRGKLIMACGSGKSLTAYWIAQKLQSKIILIAVPSLALIKQTLEVWTRESVANNIDINWLAVCSDDTVSQIDDIFTSSTKNLGIDVSTDIEYISNWLQNKTHNITIVFTTYQSGKVISQASQKANITYDLGIMDEAHKTVGLKDSLFGHLLFDENISISKRLFMTATERRYKGNSDDIASMDDIELYGEDFEVLTFKEALESNPPILCDYKIIAMMVTKKEIAQLIENNDFIKPKNKNYTKEIEAEMLASTVALHKAIKKHNIKHTISFHSSIERAKFFKTQEVIFRKSFKEYTDLDTFHVSGTTPTATRNRVIDTFSKSKNSLITNARCLTEGVDIPNIDSVLFADPKQSTVDIVQAVGRALRLSKDKKFGYVLVPILIDDENLDIEDIKNRSFQAIITILRALASSDERIIDYFQTIDNNELTNEIGLVNFDIPLGMDIDIEDFNNAIKLSIISKLKKLKWLPFEEAREFVKNLKLHNGKEWKDYCKNKIKDKKVKPIDIPSSPETVYKIIGWNGMKDWLGTTTKDKYLSYNEASQYIQNLNINSRDTWREFSKEERPDNIPSQPYKIYKNNGWINWKYFFGTAKFSYEEAKEFVYKLNLISPQEWDNYCKNKYSNLSKKPNNIPLNPLSYYKSDWISWEDWLGNSKYLSYQESKEFMISLNLKTTLEWKKYSKGELVGYEAKPNNIPTSPDRVYENEGWINYGDWLGTGRKRKGNNLDEDNTWLSYKKAREFVHRLNLKGEAEWQKYIKNELENLEKKPDNIPKSPNFVYKNKGWINWNDWLGNNGNIKTKVKNALPFEEAREFIRSLGLKNTYEWINYKKGKLKYLESIPNNIPKEPSSFYKNDGWNGMLDWLGGK